MGEGVILADCVFDLRKTRIVYQGSDNGEEGRLNFRKHDFEFGGGEYDEINNEM